MSKSEHLEQVPHKGTELILKLIFHKITIKTIKKNVLVVYFVI